VRALVSSPLFPARYETTTIVDTVQMAISIREVAHVSVIDDSSTDNTADRDRSGGTAAAISNEPGSCALPNFGWADRAEGSP